MQVQEREALGPQEIVARLADIAPKTVRGRRHVPALVRKHARLAVDGPVHETWTLGYRVDAARATGRTLHVTAEHDGRIVADVVAEWARRHGRPFVLELEGAAGGTYVRQADSAGCEHLALDAVELCRTLAGRSPAAGLLATPVPF